MRAGSRTRAELQSGRRSRRGLRKIRAGGKRRVLRNRKRSNGFQQRTGRRRCQLPWGLVAEVAVGAMRVVIPSLVMPVTHHARGKNEQHGESQAYTQDLERLAQDFSPVRKRASKSKEY